MSYLTGKRDTNEKDICILILYTGGYYIRMHETAGFDLLVFFPNGVHVVEVKNPEYKWKLTPNEKNKKAAIEAVGGVYNIVENDDDILEIRNRE